MNVLVVGNVHGNEPAGEAIIAALRERARRRRRVLARAHRQPGRPREGHAPERPRRGPQPQLPLALAHRPARHLLPRPARGLGARDAGADAASSGGQAAARDLLPPGARDDGPGAAGVDPAVQREYARRTGLPLRSLPNYRGTAIGWQNHELRDGSAFVVELHGGPASRTRPSPRQRRAGAGAEGARMKIVLVRHGQTEWSVSGQHTSTTDIPLTERGREAARALRERLAGREFALVLASPRARALETAQARGLRPRDRPGPGRGRLRRLRGPDDARDPRAAPGLDAVGRRLARRREPGAGGRAGRPRDRPRLAADGDVAVFAHGHILRVLAARWVGLPAERGGEPRARHRGGLRARLRARGARHQRLESGVGVGSRRWCGERCRWP